MVEHRRKPARPVAPPDAFATTTAYDLQYAGVHAGKTFRAIRREVYGDDYPEEADPYSFVTMTDLRRLVALLELQFGDTLVDLGCGRGGPGMWVARETGADLIGVDLSEVAIAQARERVVDFGLEGRARFEVADLRHTGLPDGSCQGAMSIDLLGLVGTRDEAIAEVARILCPGGRYAFTAWESRAADGLHYDGLLRQHGLLIEEHSEKPDWERRHRAVLARVLAAEEAVVQEMGEAAAGPIIAGATEMPKRMSQFRHMLIACRKP
jgi:ubiquinone/menaquinone biosynthesis C-methylase UbiE